MGSTKESIARANADSNTHEDGGDDTRPPQWALRHVLSRSLPFASAEEILDAHSLITEWVRRTLRGLEETPTDRRAAPSMAGGLPGAPAFLHASDEEIIGTYVEASQTVRVRAELAEQIIAREPVGGPRWRKQAEYIDRLMEVTTVDGWAGARRARMLLLAAIDDAAHYTERMTKHSEHVDVVRRLEGDPNWASWDAGTRATWKTSAMIVATETVHSAGDQFRQVTGEDPASNLTLFAAFLFRKRCAAFARGLVTGEGISALTAALASWTRTKGRPKKGDERLPKWEAADTLMKAAGLVGSTPESLESDWKDWGAYKPR